MLAVACPTSSQAILIGTCTCSGKTLDKDAASRMGLAPAKSTFLISRSGNLGQYRLSQIQDLDKLQDRLRKFSDTLARPQDAENLTTCRPAHASTHLRPGSRRIRAAQHQMLHCFGASAAHRLDSEMLKLSDANLRIFTAIGFISHEHGKLLLITQNVAVLSNLGGSRRQQSQIAT